MSGVVAGGISAAKTIRQLTVFAGRLASGASSGGRFHEIAGEAAGYLDRLRRVPALQDQLGPLESLLSARRAADPGRAGKRGFRRRAVHDELHRLIGILRGGGSGPTLLIPRRFDPDATLVLTRPGAITPWGDERATYDIAVGRPEGWARIAAQEGLIRYDGRGQYSQLDGRPILPGEVLGENEAELRKRVGPRWLPSAFDVAGEDGNVKEFGVKTPFGGLVPTYLRKTHEFEVGRDEILAALGLSKASVSRSSYPAAWSNLISVATEEALFLQMALGRAVAAGAISLGEVFADPRALGLSTGRGMPGLNAFLTLAKAAMEGKKVATGQLLPNLLQSAANGVLMAILGPKGDDVSRLDPSLGVRTLGSVFQGSHECASFHGALCIAANRLLARAPGQAAMTGMLVGASEAPHGILGARLSAVGFNSLRAMEGMEWIDKLGKRNDLWHGYPPFTDASHGFWPGEGAGFMTVMTLSAAVAAGVPFDAILAGWSVVPDQGGKSNHAQMGIGMHNAALESLRMAREGHGVGIQDLDYVSFHGTGTPDTNTKEPLILVRVLEAMGYKKGEKRIKATALKGFLTHLLGAAGAAELTLILMSMRNGRAPGIFNLTEGRQITVPTDIQEWIDFSPGLLEGEIDVAMSWSEGFSGNNASVVLARASDDALARYGLTRDEIRVLRERQAERVAMGDDLDERLRTGRLSYAELMDWAAYRDRGASMPPARFTVPVGRAADQAQAVGVVLDSERFGSIGAAIDRLAYATDRWVVLPVHAIRTALAADDATRTASGYDSQFAGLVERLDSVLERLRAGDPSAFFPTAGLPHAILSVAANAYALEVLDQNEEVARAIREFANPPKAPEVKIDKVATDAPIPPAERAYAVLFPGQGMFTDKRTEPARALYDSSLEYREIVDQAQARLHDRYGYDLTRMLFSGTPDDLVQTRHQQPVLVADELGRAMPILARLATEGQAPRVALGDSLGLIAAATLAGYFPTAADAVEFAWLRGDVMGALNPFGPDARPMAIFPKFDEATLREVVRQVAGAFGVKVTVSKRNGVHTLVISGEPEAVQLVGQRVTAMGGKMTPIGVSTPFHSAHYFGPAANELLSRARGAGLTGTRKPTGIELVSNSTGGIVPESDDGLEFLAGQIAAPVDLVANVQTAAGRGANVFLEIGGDGYFARAVGGALGTLPEAERPAAIRAAQVSDLRQLEALWAEAPAGGET